MCNPQICVYMLQWRDTGAAVLLQHGAKHWSALQMVKQPHAGTNASYKGIVTTSPSATFLVLTNNTKTRRAREENVTAASYLDWMTYHDFVDFSQRKLENLYYEHEYYYFQGVPHEELGISAAFDSLPASCLKAQQGVLFCVFVLYSCVAMGSDQV